MTRESPPEDVRVTTLPSGVRVVTETLPHVRSVSVGFWVDCGSRDENLEQLGATHFLEHLLFKGTERRSAADIAAEVDAVGGEFNAFTSKEYTCFYISCLDRNLGLAVDVLADMITSATLRPADVEAERDVVLEEIRSLMDTPDELVESLFSEVHYDGHPLGREVLGSAESISGMSRDAVYGHYKHAYAPGRLVVAAAGNCAHETVVDQVQEALADWGPDPDSGPVRQAPASGLGRQTAARKRVTEQVHLLLGGPGLPRGDEDRYAARVLNQALGAGMSSRLFQEIRERRGLVYTVASYHASYTDAGTFAVYAGTAPHKVHEVLEVVRAEFADALDEGFTHEELERAKGHLTGSLVLALEDTGSRMVRLGKTLVTGMPLLTVDETLARVEAVTPQDVQRVAKTVLGGPFTLALVGPFDGDKDVDGYERHTAALGS